MARIPENVAHSQTNVYLEELGFGTPKIGKVRRTYDFPSRILQTESALVGKQEFLLVEATDQVSVFDIVLPTLIPQKGATLSALTDFWLRNFFRNVPNHYAYSGNFPGINAVHDLKKYTLPELDLTRCLVVKKLEIEQTELIFRCHIGGSVWEDYLSTGIVAGHKLPDGLAKWSHLSAPLFTPSTKAKTGHDVNYTAKEFFDRTGEDGRRAVDILTKMVQDAYDFLINRGIVLLDTKLEIQLSPFRLADEVFTPDSSRFCLVDDLERAIQEKRDPKFFDKQFVRDYCSKLQNPFGIPFSKLDMANIEHQKYVDALQFPMEMIAKTTELYLEILNRITGKPLGQYQQEFMGIK